MLNDKKKDTRSQYLTPFTSETAKLAGKKSQKPKFHLKAFLKKVLNEKLPDEIFQKLKKKYGLEENTSQGEIAIRAIILRFIVNGNVNELAEIMKITGEYQEAINVNQNQKQTVVFAPYNPEKNIDKPKNKNQLEKDVTPDASNNISD